MRLEDALALAAAIVSGVEIARSRGQNLVAWAVIILAAAVLLPRLT